MSEPCGYMKFNVNGIDQFHGYYCCIDESCKNNQELIEIFTVCECGAEKLGYNNHSQWCPKND